MRILLVHNYYQQRGGEDGVFEAEGVLLEKYGHDVHRLAFHNDDIRTPLDGLKTGLLSVHNPKSILKLREVLRTCQPEIMHVHNFFPMASPAIFVEAKKIGVSTVMTLHNYRLVCINGVLFRDGRVCEECLSQKMPINGVLHACYRQSVPKSAAALMATGMHRAMGTWQNDVDQYIALTRFAKNKIIQSYLGVPQEKISVKPNFVEDPGYPEEKRERFFLYVGRLAIEKGIHTLLEAWKNLPDISLKIVGTGPLESEVRAAAEMYPNIEYLGFRPRQDVMTLMKRSYMLVFPSIWYEGFPLTLVEALAAGTPVLCSDIGGLPEIIQDRRNGLLFPSGNHEDLILQINTAWHDQILQAGFSKEARTYYLNELTPDTNYRKLLAIYEKARKNF